MKRKRQDEKLHRKGHTISISPLIASVEIVVDELSGFIERKLYVRVELLFRIPRKVTS
jgi:hypothetical protein